MDFIEIVNLIFKTIFSYLFLLTILKVMGKRELSQISIFDVVIFLIMSELFSLAIESKGNSILRFVIPIMVIVVLELITAFLSLKSIIIRKFFEGKSSFLIYKGKIDISEMKKNRYNISDLMLQLRNKDIQSPLEVEFAILEGNGNLNIIKKDNIIIEFPDPIIIDGKINSDALKKINKSEKDIENMIISEGYKNINEIFFCQILKNGLYIVPFKKSSDM